MLYFTFSTEAKSATSTATDLGYIYFQNQMNSILNELTNKTAMFQYFHKVLRGYTERLNTQMNDLMVQY